MNIRGKWTDRWFGGRDVSRLLGGPFEVMRESMQTVLVILGVLLLAVNVVATVAALRSETSTASQRILQSCVVWLIPLLGAFAVLTFLRLDRRSQGPAPERPRLDGSEIDVAMAVRHDGHN